MTDLERALVRLGAELDLPEAPDVSAAVLARLPARRRPVSRRRALAVALAVLALAVGTAFAVPPARSAILDFLGLEGASVTRVDTLPPVPTRPEPALDLGEPVPVEDGRPVVELAGVLVPSALGPPDAAHLADAPGGERLTLVYEPGAGVPRSPYTGVGLLVTEFRGRVERTYVDKMVAGGTEIERLTVGGAPALWLEGGPHYVAFRGEDGAVHEDVGRLAGNTLLVQRDGLLVRIEGEIDRDRAVEIADSLEP